MNEHQLILFQKRAKVAFAVVNSWSIPFWPKTKEKLVWKQSMLLSFLSFNKALSVFRVSQKELKIVVWGPTGACLCVEAQRQLKCAFGISVLLRY